MNEREREGGREGERGWRGVGRLVNMSGSFSYQLLNELSMLFC